MNTLLIRYCGLLIALIAPLHLHASESEHCTLDKLASVDVVNDTHGRPLVSVTIDGHAMSMILDTATALSWISPEAVRHLGLKTLPWPDRAARMSLAGLEIQRFMEVRGFRLGSTSLKEVDVVVSPKFGGWNSTEPAGVLGMDTLSGFDIELDLAHNTLNLFSQDHCAGKVVYWADAYQSLPMKLSPLGIYYFPMELNGRKLETLLATGETTTYLPTDVTRQLYHFDKSSPEVEVESNGRDGTKDVYRAMALTAGDGALTILKARILLFDRDHFSCRLALRDGAIGYDDECLGLFPLRLGTNVVSKLRLYLATKEKTLYLTDAEAHR
jgi:predicted aspartyl protease